jgi:mono/diheme cytochrome c family protein
LKFMNCALLCFFLGASLAAGDVHAAGADDGKVLYQSLCQTCHGVEGAGDGPAVAEFVLQPRPFSQAAFKFDTDADWEKGSDADLANVIRNGAAAYGGSATMTPWPSLSDEDVANLVAYIRSLGPPPVESANAFAFNAVYDLLLTHCGECHVQGSADGPWSLDTPPSRDRYPECLDLTEAEQLRCATYHQLVDEPGAGIPAWIRPVEAAMSEPYVQACDSVASFHIGHSIPGRLPDQECVGFLGWIEAGALP